MDDQTFLGVGGIMVSLIGNKVFIWQVAINKLRMSMPYKNGNEKDKGMPYKAYERDKGFHYHMFL